MRINNNGEVQIGSTTDAGDYKLQVTGSSYVSGNLSMGMPTASWTKLGVSPTSDGARGILYSHGSFASSWVCNGYRNASSQWTSLAINSQTGATMINQYPSGYMTFHTDANKATGSGINPTERMRVHSGGNVTIGTTDTSLFSNGASGNVGVHLHPSGYFDAARSSAAILHCNRLDSTGVIAYFYQNGGTSSGSISVTATTTAYNTTSDYRLKENVTAMTGSTARLMSLNPVQFNFIEEPGTIVDGFLAHEAAAVVPEAVLGEKDAVDGEGNPEYQGIDQSKLVPLLVAALQEANNKIDALEARIDALEA